LIFCNLYQLKIFPLLLIGIISIVLSSTFIPYSSATTVIGTPPSYDITASSSVDSKVCGDHLCGPGEHWKLKEELNAIQHKGSGSNMTKAASPTPTTMQLSLNVLPKQYPLNSQTTTPTTTPTPALNMTMWINHLEFLRSDPSVQLSFNANNSGVGSNMSGLIIGSNTIGDVATGGGDKVIATGLQVPPHYSITNVVVCYEGSNSTRSFIDQIRLAQLQNPSSMLVLDDPTRLANTGPNCVTSQPTLVNPSKGEVRLDLRLNFGDTSDKIVIRGVGLVLVSS
jgi:hypothetical protein